MLAHDSLEEGQPIHLWHLYVESYYVWNFMTYPLDRRIRIRGNPHHFDLRIGFEYLLQRLAHERGIIHDQHPNCFIECHGLSLELLAEQAYEILRYCT